MNHRQRLEKAEARVEAARATLRTLHYAVDDARRDYLVANGWEVVHGFGPGLSSSTCYRAPRSGALYTPFAAAREQQRRDHRKARAKVRKAAERTP